EAFDMPVPTGDPQFDPFGDGMQTIGLFRAGFDPATGTDTENPRQHPNLITSFLDASVVYGSDAARATALRTLDGTGRLKTSDGGVVGALLPRNDLATFPDGMLENENNGQHDPADLFAAGDVRANDNVQLLALHTLMVREHNRRADELAAADPTTTGDELYEAARRWVGALLQQITYNEFLPVLLGEGAIPQYAGYDPSVDPRISGVFSGAAFRIGHSMANEDVPRLDNAGQSLADGPLTLREAFFNPEPIGADGIEPYLLGMADQQVQEIDAQLIDALRNFLFGPPGAGGLDLISMNIQRGRDLGLPSYNQTRIDFGLAPAATFADITSDVDVQNQLASVYASPAQVDLIVGGLAEEHMAGAMVGPLFRAIIRDQFLRTRDGDRFWFENGQFAPDDLDAIRATTLADVILRNTDVATIADDVFIAGAAQRYQLPEALIRAVIHTESRYNPDAVSHVGAMGLMQLMPATARYLGVAQPFDPMQNIYGGSKYLRLLANNFNGDMVLVLAGYFSGAGAVKKYGGVPPHPGVRRYVKAVLRRYYAYER
ncbi:MAG: transglycosylase SLT domain-containing protein, partial [Planctomycetales bacterium]|nr:transglycosylase SLT domain-containing protein [Planctomycetales bacterium]